ncbi:PD-(D/E)XK nuclease family protein [Anaeroselena agilis]|uniref:PD-(D/E)XK nuclease family protein n=1 Tax=Anaeroselena agilis TaxID=3063788 RepID=A0ABU3NVQ1_9FIRM|nr:PD-(D/E)XK nuclease family protein [Selenomonadales bacterium 4137-cl]
MITHLSPSTVQSYRKCGRLVYYRKIMGLPDTTVYAATAYGTAIHRSIETLLREKKMGFIPSVDEVIHLFDQELRGLADTITVWGEDTKEHLFEQGAASLDEFCKKWLPRIAPAEIEKEFMVRREGRMPIKCIADCVDTNDAVWDWKTGRGFTGTANSAEYGLNMATYAKAFYDEHGYFPKSIRILRTKWNGKLNQATRKKKWYHSSWEMDELVIPPESIPYYMGLYDETEKGIAAGVFLPISDGGGLCKNCSYRGNPCDVHIVEVGK